MEEECFQQLIDERIEKSLAILRESATFANLMKVQCETMDKLLARISEKEIRAIVTAYEEQENDISGIQLKAVYQAGALDAITLLKKIGVF